MFASDIRTVTELRLLPDDSFYITVNGKIVTDWKTLKEGTPFAVHFRLRGGKGGFGSLLRSFRIHRSTNQLMCRDLSGRRLADIKEEEKLRKWIEKAAEREEAKRRQRQEKYEKLKAGPPKHDFNDPIFIETREKILDETDEAFEAGITAARDKKTDKISAAESDQKSQITKKDDEGGDFEKSSVLGRKRKPTDDTEECKKRKPENDCKSVSSVVSSEVTKSGAEKGETSENRTAAQKAKQVSAIEVKAHELSIHVEEINLDNYDNAESLQSLGLDCLKHALEVRGLKCGGTLVERAVRLYSVKGLKPEQYPKNIRTGGKKK